MSLNKRIRLLWPLGALALLVVLLACGPAAPSNPISIPELPVAQPQESSDPTPQPTRTLPPDDYVKPTVNYPTYTPFPTLPPDPTQTAEELLASAQSQMVAPSLTDQVTSFTEAGDYDAIVRLRMTGHRTIEQDTSVTWPPDPPFFINEGEVLPWHLQDITIVETYYGELPETYSLMETALLPTTSLETNREYILFVTRLIEPDTAPEDQGVWRLTAAQLTAFGGIAGTLKAEHSWVIERDTAWRTPYDGGWDFTPGSDLATAKTSNESLSVTDLVAAINAGLE